MNCKQANAHFVIEVDELLSLATVVALSGYLLLNWALTTAALGILFIVWISWLVSKILDMFMNFFKEFLLQFGEVKCAMLKCFALIKKSSLKPWRSKKKKFKFFQSQRAHLRDFDIKKAAKSKVPSNLLRLINRNRDDETQLNSSGFSSSTLFNLLLIFNLPKCSRVVLSAYKNVNSRKGEFEWLKLIRRD